MAKFIKKQNMTISSGKYIAKDGSEKNSWHNIGSIITMQNDDGSQYQFGELPMLGLKFSIYDQKPKEGATGGQGRKPIAQKKEVEIPVIDEGKEIDVKDIPF